jgi:hypothetical protein
MNRDERIKEIITHLRIMSNYWARLPDLSPQERCEGMAFSCLTMIDGVASINPITLVQDGVALNEDCHLHDMFYERKS